MSEASSIQGPGAETPTPKKGQPEGRLLHESELDPTLEYTMDDVVEKIG